MLGLGFQRRPVMNINTFVIFMHQSTRMRILFTQQNCLRSATPNAFKMSKCICCCCWINRQMIWQNARSSCLFWFLNGFFDVSVHRLRHPKQRTHLIQLNGGCTATVATTTILIVYLNLPHEIPKHCLPNNNFRFCSFLRALICFPCVNRSDILGTNSHT